MALKIDNALYGNNKEKTIKVTAKLLDWADCQQMQMGASQRHI